MPELDPDVFEWLAVGLLGLILLVLLLTLLTLGRIRRAVERSGEVEELGRIRRAVERSVEVVESAARREPSGHAVPSAAADDRPAEADGPLDTGAYLRAESARRASAEREPLSEQAAQVEPAAETREQAAIPARHEPPAQQEPEEQPFERDGRWWFRRDGELLVYDERTGQWGPAPEQDPASTVVSSTYTGAPLGGAAGPGGHQETDVTSVLPVQSPASSSEQSVSEASFWKCRSCGAINTQEASSCRMCFTPKGLT